MPNAVALLRMLREGWMLRGAVGVLDYAGRAVYEAGLPVRGDAGAVIAYKRALVQTASVRALRRAGAIRCVGLKNKINNVHEVVAEFAAHSEKQNRDTEKPLGSR